MDTAGFRSFLEEDPSITSEKAIASRILKLADAEKILGRDVDEIVESDDLMYASLTELRNHEDIAHSPRQNALRKYYTFRTGKEFSRLKGYPNNSQ
ncbi:MAG: hypothetical protein IJL80_05085 [Treponema sp.]|nr:hypothetical protein [Treponema sp.]MBQ9539274.1 hypothetical protein [Treponema sp.]